MMRPLGKRPGATTAAARAHGPRAGAAAALVLLCACQDAHEEPAPIRPVLVEDVRVRGAQMFGPFAGTIEPRYTTSQGFRTSGRMITRDVDVGDRVARGQRLTGLDQTLLSFAVTQARSNVVNAQAQLKTAEAADARKQILARSQAVPQSDVDAASADQKTAAAKLDQAEAALAKARDSLGYAALDAEFDGVVMAWNAEVGQDVAEGAGVVTLARLDMLEAVVDIPDALIDRVREKDAFTVALQAAGGIDVRGIVREIAPGASGATRTRRVRFALEAPSQAFRIGSTVTVSFTSPLPSRLEVPEAALLRRDGETAVWVVPPDAATVSLRRVRVVERRDGVAAVEGLDARDRVVRVGINRLKDGQPVTVATALTYP